jgi:hypothetical protein
MGSRAAPGFPSISCLGLRYPLAASSNRADNGRIIMQEHVALSDIRSTIERQLKQARESLELLKRPKPSTFCGKRHHPPPTFEQPPPIHDWVDAFRLYPQKD